MTNSEAIQIFQKLENNKLKLDQLKGTDIVYKITKNYNLLYDYIVLLNELIKPSDVFIEYNNKRIEICEKYADKEQDGTIIKYLDDFGIECYSLDLDNELFKNEILELQNQYQDTISLNDIKIKKYNQELNSECLLEFEYFTINELKEYNSDLSKSIIDSLYSFIK